MRKLWLSQSRRIVLPVILTVVLFILPVVVIVIPELDDAILRERLSNLQRIVDGSISILGHFHRREAAGELSRAEALVAAREALRSFRYDAGDEPGNYLFGAFLLPESCSEDACSEVLQWLHPIRPETEGQNTVGLQDTVGHYFVAEMAKKSLRDHRLGTHEAFVRYLGFQRGHKDKREVIKTSFTRYFAPWNLMVGSSLYIPDVDNDVRDLAFRVSRAYAFLFLLVAGIAAYAVWQTVSLDHKRAVTETRLSETSASLVEKQNLLRTVFDALPVWVLVKDRDGVTTLVNRRLVEATGLPESAWIGMRVMDMPHLSAGQKREVAAEDALVVSTSQSAETMWTGVAHATGAERSLRTVRVPLRNGNGEVDGVVTISEDVTARVQSEQALRESEERYRAMVDKSLQGIVVAGKDWKILFANEAEARIFGFASPSEMEGGSFSDLLAPEEAARMLSYRDARLRGEDTPSRYEARGVRKDGSTVWVEFSAGTISWRGEPAVLGMHVDVTARKQTEAALQQSIAQLRRAERGSNDGLWDWTIQTGEEYFSPRWMEILGYGPGELPANVESFRLLLHPDDKLRVREAAERHLRTGAVFDEEMRLRCKDGAYLWVRSRGQAERDGQGLPIRMAGFISDISARKQAEDALRESEARLRRAESLAQIGHYAVDPDGSNTVASDGLKSIFGLDPKANPSMADFVGRVKSKDHERVMTEFNAAFGELRGFDLIYGIKRPDGVEIVVRSLAEVSRDERTGRPRYFGTLVDITDQRRAQEALRDSNAQLEARVAARTRELSESERRYRTLVDSSLQGIQVIRDGVCLFANAAEAHMLGCGSPRELVGKPTLSWDSEADLPLAESRSRRVLAGESVPNATFRFRRKDGTSAWIEAGLNAIEWEGSPALLSLHIDMTDRHVAEQALRESEQRYRSIVDTANEGIWTLDLDGNITFANAQVARMLGAAQQDMARRCIQQFVFPEDEKELRELMESHRRGGSLVVDFRFRREDGAACWVLLSGTPTRGGNQEASGALWMLTDITERKRAQESLAQAQSELLRKEKLATVGQLTATVSHELRNPLGTIRASIYSLRDKLGTGPDPALRRIVDRIDRNVDRCDNIVTDLLDFSRTRELTPVHTPLEAWLRDELGEMNLPHWLDVELIMPTEPLSLRLDVDRFRRVLVNLVENAVQAMNGQRESDPEREFVLRFRAGREAGRTTLMIEDSGPGIPPDVLPRIFDPLFSTKTYGVGLGLPTVRQIVREHGGEIDIRSELGKGTVATLSFALPN